MKKVFLLAMLLTGCGYSSRDNVLTGQAKKVAHMTPLICGDRVDVDVSMGVMRNGVGSMSGQDVWLTVPNREDQKVLEEASKAGAIVDIYYDVARVAFCWNDHIVTKVELAK